MKKILIGIAIISILAAGTIAFAHGPGGWGRHMAGPGHKVGMMGPDFAGPMMGRGHGPDQAFLDETADLRRELHNKKFEYFEARRDPKTTLETLSKLEKEIFDVKSRIREKAPRIANRGFVRYDRCQ